jgi:two-component system chemotaxis response regulator CheY
MAEKKRILIVDDSAIVRQQVGWTLLEAGFNVVEAVDGQDALEKMATQSNLAMVVCDVNMPRLDGLELLAKLREGGKPLPVPVLMLTTEGHAERITEAKRLGAKGWMVKPVPPSILVATVRKLTGPDGG